MTSLSALISWKRPANVQYPIIWQTFQAKDNVNEEKLVEYRIQDLPESRFEDAIQHMTEHFLPEEPITQALDCATDTEYVRTCQLIWRTIIWEKLSLVCFKEGSDEIVALNLLFVNSKDDGLTNEIKRSVIKAPNAIRALDAFELIYHVNKYNPFTHYNIDMYLASIGLTVSRNYRGQKISGKLLETRKYCGHMFGLKLTHNRFSNERLWQIAKNVGFKADLQMSFEDIGKYDKNLNFPNIKSKFMTAGTWIF